MTNKLRLRVYWSCLRCQAQAKGGVNLERVELNCFPPTFSPFHSHLQSFLYSHLTMDDDIQFIGMVSPISTQKPSYPHPNNPPTLQPPASGAFLAVQSDDTNCGALTYNLIGIMLVIPKSGDEPTQTLRFLKSRSAVVHIGRASSSVVDPDKSPDSIQFRCPVISRRHARLMFSSGHVCVFPPSSIPCALSPF